MQDSGGVQENPFHPWSPGNVRSAPVAAVDAPRIGCSRNPNVTKVAAVDAPRIGCSKKRTYNQGGSGGCSSRRMLQQLNVTK